MRHQCPSCQHEYEAKFNFCPQCGASIKASPKNFAKEPAEMNEATAGASGANVTSHMDEFFPTTAHQVEPLTGASGGARAAETPHRQVAGKESKPSTEPSAADPAYYRSIQKLSTSVVVSNGLMMLGVICITITFTVSQNRQWNTTQERLLAFIDKLQVTNQTLTAQVEQLSTSRTSSDAKAAELTKEVNAKLEQANAKLEEANAMYERAKNQSTEQHLAAMPAKLTKKEISTVAGNVASIAAKTKDSKTRRILEAFSQTSLLKGDRMAALKDCDRVLSQVDVQTRAAIVDMVRNPLAGE